MNITKEQWQEILDLAYDKRGENFLEAIRCQLNAYQFPKAKRAPMVLHNSHEPYKIRVTVDGVEVQHIGNISISVLPGKLTQATIETVVLTEQDITLG